MNPPRPSRRRGIAAALRAPTDNFLPGIRDQIGDEARRSQHESTNAHPRQSHLGRAKSRCIHRRTLAPGNPDSSEVPSRPRRSRGRSPASPTHTRWRPRSSASSPSTARPWPPSPMRPIRRFLTGLRRYSKLTRAMPVRINTLHQDQKPTGPDDPHGHHGHALASYRDQGGAE